VLRFGAFEEHARAEQRQNQIINADEASDQPRLPATGSTNHQQRKQHTRIRHSQRQRRMRVTFCSQLIRRSSAAR
jgi:hypothetical protein